MLYAFVMVVDRHREHLLGVLLTDHVGIEVFFDRQGLGHFLKKGGGDFLFFLQQNLPAYLHAFVADIDPRACYHLFGKGAALAAKRAEGLRLGFFRLSRLGHVFSTP